MSQSQRKIVDSNQPVAMVGPGSISEPLISETVISDHAGPTMSAQEVTTDVSGPGIERKSSAAPTTDSLAKAPPPQLIVVRWNEGQPFDVIALRDRLKRAIDVPGRRVIIDLRAVTGTPPLLFELLWHVSLYAKAKSKAVALRVEDPEMRRRLQENTAPAADGDTLTKSKFGAYFGTDATPAGESADDVLRSHRYSVERAGLHDEESTKPSRSQLRKKNKPKRKRTLRDNLIFGGVLLTGASIVVFLEYRLVYHDSNDAVAVPEKSFESDDQSNLIARQEQQIEQLEAELERVRRERDILKEALRITRSR
ncbi:hypothetical protein [Neorhodopirellula pilleata]|uniref:STAS domain-containing protein n=1 Tax=Neorhodopirellula pilleata TaxID=2714738 RepID=A0A5C6ARI1_9BACT|nr:hypothetical protein [Neorhodopirellula pilleata]TWU01839.1 hypothetical protein Pla100_15750 [Neorhodopirellula pilleata]